MEDALSSAHADFLSALGPKETTALLGRAEVIKLERRETLFEVGDSARAVFIVSKGCIKLYQIAPDGKEVILWFSFPGEIFGLAELLSGAEREITAQANVASEIYAIRQPEILEFLRSYPEASLRAIGILSARVRTLGNSLVNLASDDVETRLVRLLLRMAAICVREPCSHPPANGGLCINVSVTHQDIASQIGASRQTVTSILTGLKRRGVIETVDRHFHVLQPDQLRRIAELDSL